MPKSKRSGRRESGTGSIYRDGNGWRADVFVCYDKEGKEVRKRTRAATHEEAVRALKQLQRELEDGRITLGKSPTVAAYFEAWLAKVKSEREHSTYRSYEWIARQHILPTLGRKRLDKLSRPDVRALLLAKSKETVSPRGNAPVDPAVPRRHLGVHTLKTIRAVLRAALQDAIGDDLIVKNPATDVEVPGMREQDTGAGKATGFLDPTQAERLLASCGESDLGDLFAFLLTTGARIGEATGVRWEDLDLGESPKVVIGGQLRRVDGKLTYVGRTKTKRVREVPLTAEVADRLRALSASRLVDGVKDPDGIVFLNSLGRRIDSKHANDRLAELCEIAGVPRVSAHKLRHTCGAYLRHIGAPDYLIQLILGHSQQAVTTDLYGRHSTAEMLRPAADLMSKLERPRPIAD